MKKALSLAALLLAAPVQAEDLQRIYIPKGTGGLVEYAEDLSKLKVTIGRETQEVLGDHFCRLYRVRVIRGEGSEWSLE